MKQKNNFWFWLTIIGAPLLLTWGILLAESYTELAIPFSPNDYTAAEIYGIGSDGKSPRSGGPNIIAIENNGMGVTNVEVPGNPSDTILYPSEIESRE